jgi:hypothetical protein
LLPDASPTIEASLARLSSTQFRHSGVAGKATVDGAIELKRTDPTAEGSK